MTNDNGSSLRIERLERANRRIKWALGLYMLLSALFAVFVLLRHPRKENTLEANEFVVTDKAGHVMARLGSSPVGTCLEILGKTKEATATLCAGDESGSELLLTTHHGRSRAFLSAGGKFYESVGQTVLPGLIIAEVNGGSISASVGTEGKLGLDLVKEQNAVVISVPESKPAISLLGKDGKTLWTAP
jgi:hypothetical protein